ncbi:MAG: 13E12 repeat family protein, partial [Micrococcaceae bacterium]|nr:13E12 repeat family protein [Micrococcaceae bacterium]
MDAINEAVSVNGWQLTRQSATAVDGSTRFKAAEALARFAEAEKFRAAAMLHDEAQQAIDPRLEALQNRPGMRISLRTGRIVSSAATDSAAMEIALIAGLSPGQGQRVLDQAETLVMDTPEVLESLALGRIGASHVQRILEHTHHITAEPPALPARDADEARKEEFERDVAAAAARARADRRDFGADMLAIAAGKSPTQLRARGRQVLEKYYGFSFTKRSRTELRDRRIELEQARDGMTWFSGYLPTASCQAIFAKVDAMARLLKTDPETAAAVSQAAAHAAGNTGPGHDIEEVAPGRVGELLGQGAADPAPGAGAGDDAGQFRTLDQLRADVFTDMMLNGPRGQGLETVDAQVFVTIPATMLPGTEGGPTGIDQTPVNG